jgi:hypothetical protein
MILPARCKQFFVETSLGRRHERFWDGLWSQAAEALKYSEKVVICGYSVPEYDQRACDLLLKGNYLASIEVCCGEDTERVVEKLRERGRNAHGANEHKFDGWLNRRLSSNFD